MGAPPPVSAASGTTDHETSDRPRVVAHGSLASSEIDDDFLLSEPIPALTAANEPTDAVTYSLADNVEYGQRQKNISSGGATGAIRPR